MRFLDADFYSVVSVQSKGTAVRPDGIAMEAYILGTDSLYEHLANLLNMCLNHCYLPVSLMHSVLVPLIMNKNGDLCDMNNYRALSNSLKKNSRTWSIYNYIMLYLLIKD